MKLITISPFWNAGNNVKKSILSLKNQYYTNFISYYIDDMSTDDSYEIAKEAIGDDERFVLIKNTEKKFKTKNFIDTIRNNDRIGWDDVIVEIDGDDRLSDNFVLGRINKVFSDDNIWLCGTRWKDSKGILGNYAKPDPDRARSTVWNFSHMRSFRAFLFREIKDEHLKFEGSYFKAACDLGHSIPMMEMAGSEHFYYINEPLYTYTWHNNQSYSENNAIGDKTIQSKTAKHIYKLPKYQKLTIVREEESLENAIRMSEQEVRKAKRMETLSKLGLFSEPNKKSIDYNLINDVLNKKNVYHPQKNIKPIRQNTPKNREQIFKVKNESVTDQIRKITPGKPNRRNGLPNIF